MEQQEQTKNQLNLEKEKQVQLQQQIQVQNSENSKEVQKHEQEIHELSEHVQESEESLKTLQEELELLENTLFFMSFSSWQKNLRNERGGTKSGGTSGGVDKRIVQLYDYLKNHPHFTQTNTCVLFNDSKHLFFIFFFNSFSATTMDFQTKSSKP